MYCLTVLKTRSLRSRFQQDWFILKDMRKNLLHVSHTTSGGLLAIFGILWHSFASRSITSMSTFIFKLCFPCMHIYLQICPLRTQSYCMGTQPNNLIFTCAPLKIPYLQINHVLRYGGFRFQHMIWGKKGYNSANSSYIRFDDDCATITV